MKQEVIQGFLNVPGIAGIALIHGLARPCFYGFTPGFDFSQQDSIAQSIQQVLETTPEGFNSFEFQFDYYRLYLHKLKLGMTLLVLTANQLPRGVYTQEVRRLLLELQLDQDDPIAEFQAIMASLPLLFQPPSSLEQTDASSTTLPAHHNGHAAPISEPESKSQSKSENKSDITQPRPEPLEPLPKGVMAEALMPEDGTPEDAIPEASRPEEPLPVPLPEPSRSLESTAIESTVSVQEVLVALNRLSQLTTQYLGTIVVTNYWKASRPEDEWLLHFQIERSAQITFVVQMPSQRLPVLTPDQHQSLQTWVAAFIQRCTRVIRGFAKIVHHALTERQKALLLPPPTEVTG